MIVLGMSATLIATFTLAAFSLLLFIDNSKTATVDPVF